LPGLAPLVTGYRAVAHLRRGDLCDVYDAWSEEREVRCVVKILRPDRRANPTDRRRVMVEGELLLSLTHPHIVRAYEVREDPVPFIALEAATGDTLARLIDHGPLPARDLARLATQMCSALSYLHRRGYLHLDLKPSNVAWDRGYARLLDLSIARRPGRAPGIGTTKYLSAEQARGGALTEATDVWGLGCLLYEAATGRAPLGHAGIAAGVEMPPPLKKHRRLRLASESIVLRCLSPAPEDRPSIGEIARIFAPLV
jgi:serine/threonine protein kinase